MNKSLFKRKEKTIVFDDIKKKRKDKLTLIFLAVIAVIALGVGIYFLVNFLKKPPAPSDGFDAHYIDPKFELLTLKSLIEFESPTFNYNNYRGNKTFFAYFYKSGKIERSSMADTIKIVTTINRMFDCVNKSNEDACGIKKIETGYKTSNKEVLKYAKLLYGPSVTINHQTVNIPYGNVTNINYLEDNYTFEQIKDNTYNSLLSYIDQEVSLKVENNQAILIKAVGYVEERRANYKLSGYSVYTNDEKTNELYKKDNHYETSLDIVNEVRKNLVSKNAPMYKLIFDRQSDGTYIFKQIESYAKEK